MATISQRDALIARLEAQVREDPAAYRRRVALLAAIGYGYIGLVLLLTLAALAGRVVLTWWIGGRGLGL